MGKEKPQAHIVRTGTANLASVAAAIERAGWQPQLVSRPQEIETAEWVVLPGVGTLAAAMTRLKDDGLRDPLLQRLQSGRATLAICLGLQLLAESSEESPHEPGLGILRAKVRRFPATVRVPQLGWNIVQAQAEERQTAWLSPGYAYFANSYCLDSHPGEGWSVAWSHHGIKFIAAVARGRVLACQFHPELSGPWGHELLQWWLKGGVPC
jgi:imidazole glycerol phosphate synthase glutamine amidotransferase subunit